MFVENYTFKKVEIDYRIRIYILRISFSVLYNLSSILRVFLFVRALITISAFAMYSTRKWFYYKGETPYFHVF